MIGFILRNQSSTKREGENGREKERRRGYRESVCLGFFVSDLMREGGPRRG